jgi:uncharacterized surface protein with fasciclin (FAS1) repeats
MKNLRLPTALTPLALATITAALSAALSACASMSAPKTLADTVAASPQHTTLAKLLKDAELNETLQGAGPFTLFAPTDDAFKAVPPATLDALAKDKTKLKAVLTYHVVPGNLKLADAKNGPVKTVQGGNLAIYKAGTFTTVDDALVTAADVPASNGSLEVIDKVLLPR